MDKVAEQTFPGRDLPRPRRPGRLPGLAATGAVLVLGALALILLFAGQAAISQHRAAFRLEQQAMLAQDIATALVTAENGARGFVLTGNPDALEPYYRGREQVQVALARAADHLDDWRRRDPLDQPVAEMVASRLAGLGQMVDQAYRDLAARGRRPAPRAADPGDGDGLRLGLERLVAELRAQTSSDIERINRRTDLILPAMAAVLVLGLGLSVLGFVAFRRESRERREAEGQLERHGREARLLRGLAAGMQSVRSRAAGHRMVADQLAETFPDCSGLLFVHDQQCNRFVAVADWGPLIVEQDCADLPAEHCEAARHGEAVTGGHGHGRPVCDHVQDAGYVHRCQPILVEGEVAGILHLRLATDGDADAAFARLGTLPEAAAGLLGLVLGPLEQRERLKAQALRDPLTGLCNRDFLYEILGRELDRAAAAGRPVSLIMAEIDGLQALNDRHGPRAGDKVVKTIAAHLRGQLRDDDLLCRFGGDRLALLLPDTDPDHALRIAEQLQHGVTRLRPAIGREVVDALSLSLGVATASRDGRDPETLVAAADRAVSQAKLGGSDRVIRAGEAVGAA